MNDSSVLADLLLKATDKRNQELDLGVLRRIKALCKKSEEHIRAVHDYLLHALEANHAQVCTHLWLTIQYSFTNTSTEGPLFCRSSYGTAIVIPGISPSNQHSWL